MDHNFPRRNVDKIESQVVTETREVNKRWHILVRMAVDTCETILLAVLILLGINGLSARIRVDGTSMEPNLHTGEYVVVNKFAYKLEQPHLGDVIVFHFPGDPEQEYIKRVIGVPGDIVEVDSGQVYVNGIRLQEPYIAAEADYQGSWFVPQASLFVLGDNRNNSSDSHTWGMVPFNYVIGKAVFIYWPLDQWGTLTRSVKAAP
jgi:signal peptidase I